MRIAKAKCMKERGRKEKIEKRRNQEKRRGGKGMPRRVIQALGTKGAI